MKNILSLIILSLCLCGCSTYSITPKTKLEMKKSMTKQFFNSSNGINFVYRAYYPSSIRKLPVVFYLHGAGQRGTDNNNQLDVGVGSLMSITEEREEFKSIVIAPQCPTNYFWRDEKMLIALSEFIKNNTNKPYVDTNRIYITGYSMGGDASWKIAINYPELITTAMPICGGPLEYMEPDRPEINKETADLNIWAFNNFDDTIVRPNYSKYVFSKLWSYKIDDKLNFTENIEGGHDASNIYMNRKYMIWFLSTRK